MMKRQPNECMRPLQCTCMDAPQRNSCRRTFTAACRTCNNNFVVNQPHLRFYCSAPLVASNGHRIGTM